MRLPCGDALISARAARSSFALALIAFAGGIACIMVGHWPPALILVFAGVAGTMTSLQAWQMRGPMSQRNPDDDHAA